MWSLLIVTTCLFFSAKASLRTSTSPSQRNTASHKWRGRVPNSQQFLPVQGCRMREPGELWGLAGAPKHRLGRSDPFRSCRRGQPGISDLTSFIHPCHGPPVKAQGGWAAPVGAATCKTSFSAAYICFSYLSQVLTMQPSIPAGQGGQAGRWVCPAAGQGGLWHLVPQLVASQWPGLAPLWGWHSQRALALPSRWWFGLRMSSPGLASSGGSFVPVLVDCSLAGPAWRKAAGLVWPCQLPPRASHWTWTTNKALSLRTGSEKKKTEIRMLLNQKRGK